MKISKKSFDLLKRRLFEDFSYGKQSLSSAVSTVELLFFHKPCEANQNRDTAKFC